MPFDLSMSGWDRRSDRAMVYFCLCLMYVVCLCQLVSYNLRVLTPRSMWSLGLVPSAIRASPLLALLGIRRSSVSPMTARLVAESLSVSRASRSCAGPSSRPHLRRRHGLGATYTALAVVLSALGSIVAHRNHREHLPLWQTMAGGSVCLSSPSLAIASGKRFASGDRPLCPFAPVPDGPRVESWPLRGISRSSSASRSPTLSVHLS